MNKTLYTIYHDRDYIIHSGYKPTGVIKDNAAWYNMRRVAIELDVPMDKIHAFRVAPDTWEYFTRGDLSDGFQDQALLG